MAVTLTSVSSNTSESSKAESSAINSNLTRALHNRQTYKKPTNTGTIDTKAILRLEQCAMQATLDIFQSGIEKLIRKPIKGYAGMRATVAIGMPLTLPMQDKTVNRYIAIAQFKLTATRIGDFIDMTYRPISW